MLPEINWPEWARSHRTPQYLEGWYAIRRTDNPYPAGTWAHEQWNRGYDDDHRIAGG